jgi:phage terminase small subunit
MPGKLTDQQKLFVLEYLECWNATQAYMASHPKCKRRSAAQVNGSRALSNTIIRAQIDEKLKERAMGANEVLARLADEARGDIGVFMDVSTVGWNIDLLQRDSNGELIRDAAGKVIRKPETKLIKKLKQKVTTIIGKAENGEDREIVETEIELYDAQAAKVHIGRHLKLFTDQVDVTSGGKRIVVDMLDDADE